MKIDIPKEKLAVYVEKEYSTREIGDLCGVSQSTINRLLDKHKLKTMRRPGPKLQSSKSFRAIRRDDGLCVGDVYRCIWCGKEMKEERLFCPSGCQRLYIIFEARFCKGSKSNSNIKKYLLYTRGHQCSICSQIEWNDLPIPLEVDHIDGHHENTKEKNVRLLCPNCHAQTPTYKGKNKGNGRTQRMKRYKEGDCHEEKVM